jgi:hypothetical protein
MVRCFTIALLAGTFLAVPLSAQRRGMGFAPAVHPASRGSFTARTVTARAEHPFGGRQFFLGNPYFYPDYAFDVAGEPAGPAVVVIQVPPSAPAIEKSPPEALLLELRGDRFVRVGADDYAPDRVQTAAQSSEQISEPSLQRVQPRRESQAAVQPPRELPPAVLVFRDGHKEEVSSYTIAGRVLYADANYWTQGSWTRKIQIADLDVPSTLKLNRERGANFSLPNGPNEVMIRP